MRALIQRVSSGGVKISKESHEENIETGLVILLGISQNDTEKEVDYVSDKCINLRIFEDEEGKMNRSVKDINGEILLISQFTLYGDTRKGNRPSFNQAAKPDLAKELYRLFLEKLKIHLGAEKIKEGIFGEMMKVTIINEGPVTVL
ncbi:MAG: D-aminoacyl-tRNA deacylase, partial [Melioribacteraceae bacterium]|nr:D-aminoacyl-tRNA deacylase [Melioribacteraceae bacterium]